MKKEVFIIGAGPAGLTAAIYAARAGAEVCVAEKAAVGGQAATTAAIENYPGFDKPINGAELAERMRMQALAAGAEVISAEVTAADFSNGIGFVLADGSEVSCRAAVIAAGAYPRELGIPGEQELRGAGVSYCASCDGAFFRGLDVAVIGGGDSAFEEALYLSNVANRVYLIHRRDEFRAQAALVERARAAENIELITSARPLKILGKFDVSGIEIEERGCVRTIDVAGCFPAIGRVPDTAFLGGALKLDENGYIIAGEDTLTSAAGVFAAGDARTKHLRQIATAAADGAAAGNAAAEYARRL